MRGQKMWLTLGNCSPRTLGVLICTQYSCAIFQKTPMMKNLLVCKLGIKDYKFTTSRIGTFTTITRVSWNKEPPKAMESVQKQDTQCLNSKWWMCSRSSSSTYGTLATWCIISRKPIFTQVVWMACFIYAHHLCSIPTLTLNCTGFSIRLFWNKIQTFLFSGSQWL